MIAYYLHFFIDYLFKDFDHYRPLIVIWSAAYEDESLRKKTGEFSVPDKYTASAFLIAFIDGILIRQILVGDLDLKKIKEGTKAFIDRILPPQKK